MFAEHMSAHASDPMPLDPSLHDSRHLKGSQFQRDPSMDGDIFSFSFEVGEPESGASMHGDGGAADAHAFAASRPALPREQLPSVRRPHHAPGSPSAVARRVAVPAPQSPVAPRRNMDPMNQSFLGGLLGAPRI